jgi:AcrR family transcriptional regulator
MKTLKQAKYDLVIENSKNLILKKGINNLTITDIAREIGVGEATIYRYFQTKVNLAIEIDIRL